MAFPSPDTHHLPRGLRRLQHGTRNAGAALADEGSSEVPGPGLLKTSDTLSTNFTERKQIFGSTILEAPVLKSVF